MLRQAQAILGHRAFIAVGVLMVLVAGIHLRSLDGDGAVGALAVCALAGAYIGLSLQRLLRSHYSQTVPGYVVGHLIIAFASQIFVVAFCVLGASGLAKNFAGMFAALLGWSLLCSCAGYLGKIPMNILFWLQLLLMSMFYGRLRDSFLVFIQSPFSPRDLILLVVDGILVVLMVVWMRRRPSEEGFTLPWPRKAPPRTAEALDEVPYFLPQRPWARIRQLRLSLKPDYWPLSLLMTAAFLIWGRYGGGPFRLSKSNFEPIYAWCSILCYLMLGQGAFTRDRVRSLFPLPVNRHNLIRDYGLTLFLSCAQRWCGFVLVAWFAARAPLPGLEPLSPRADVWGYCAGILLIMFGLRALVGSWNDRLLFRILGTWVFVFFASLSEELPMSPVLALVIGLGLITAAYYRWHHVEME